MVRRKENIVIPQFIIMGKCLSFDVSQPPNTLKKYKLDSDAKIKRFGVVRQKILRF